MSTIARYGTATLTYTPEGAGSPVVHQLAAPLIVSQAHGFGWAEQRQRWSGWSADGRTREVFVLDSGTEEIVGTIRFEDQPGLLRTLLREALYNNVEVTYSTEEYVNIPVLVVAVEGSDGGAIALKPDRDRGAMGEWEVSVLLRRVDGGTFEDLLL